MTNDDDPFIYLFFITRFHSLTCFLSLFFFILVVRASVVTIANTQQGYSGIGKKYMRWFPNLD